MKRLILILLILSCCSKPNEPEKFSYLGTWEGTWQAIGVVAPANFTLNVMESGNAIGEGECYDEHPSAGLIVHRILLDMVIDEEGNLSGTMYYYYDITGIGLLYARSSTCAGELLTDGTGYGYGPMMLFGSNFTITFECEKQ